MHKLLNGFVEIDTWISMSFYMDIWQNCYMDLLKLLHGIVKVVLCISRPLPNKTKLDQDFKVCWSFCFQLKVSNEKKYSMPWVRCAFGIVWRTRFISNVCLLNRQGNKICLFNLVRGGNPTCWFWTRQPHYPRARGECPMWHIWMATRIIRPHQHWRRETQPVQRRQHFTVWV